MNRNRYTIDAVAQGNPTGRDYGLLGPKVKPWVGTCASGKAPRPDGDPAMPRCMGAFRAPGLVLEGITMIPVAEMFSTQRRLLGRIVQDRTSPTGPYNIELEFDFTAANQSDYSGPSIFTGGELIPFLRKSSWPVWSYPVFTFRPREW
jgi:hypothetical protein